MQPMQTEGVFSKGRRALTLGIVLAITALALEGMGVVPALPTAVRELGGRALFGWAFSAFMLAWIVGSVAAGLAADARGPRWPMAAGMAGFCAGLVMAGGARGMTQFLAGRTLQGAGGGAILATVYVAIARGYADSLRARMMALTASVWILPAMLGPSLSGAVTQWFGWRAVFLGTVPLIAVSAFLVLPPLAPFDVHLPARGPARLVSAASAAVGSALLLAILGARHPASAPALAGRIAGGAAGALMLAWALRALTPPGTWRFARGLPATIVARNLLAFSFFGAEAYVPLGAIELRGATPTAAALALSGGAFGWISATWVQDRLERRDGPGGRVTRVRAGFCVLAVGVTVVAAALLSSLPFVLVPVGWAVAGAGIGTAYSAGGLLAIAAAPPTKEGEVSAQLQLSEAIGTSFGAGIGGALSVGLMRAGLAARPAQAALFAVSFVVALAGAKAAPRLASSPTEPRGGPR